MLSMLGLDSCKHLFRHQWASVVDKGGEKVDKGGEKVAPDEKNIFEKHVATIQRQKTKKGSSKIVFSVARSLGSRWAFDRKLNKQAVRPCRRCSCKM